MRVTDSMRTMQALHLQARAAERQQAAASRAASGFKVQRPSDDVGAFGRATQLRSSVSQMSARADGAALARSDVDIAESSLAAASDTLVSAQELALRMANGSFSAQDRAAASAEVASLRASFLAAANAKGSAGHLFGGTRTDAPPFDAAGIFVGRDDLSQIEVATGTYVAANVSGAKAFTAAGGQSAFEAFDKLALALQNNDPVLLQTAQKELETSHAQVARSRVEAGLASERLASAEDVGRAALVQLEAALAGTVEVDPIAAYSELLGMQQAYERSIAVTRQLLSMSTQGGG
jgi:flagellar hook-associated protein 3 FlgL